MPAQVLASMCRRLHYSSCDGKIGLITGLTSSHSIEGLQDPALSRSGPFSAADGGHQREPLSRCGQFDVGMDINCRKDNFVSALVDGIRPDVARAACRISPRA